MPTIYLCGHSFGALIAQDLAWLLEQKGYRIKVIMLDACFDDIGGEMENASNKSLDKLIAQVYGIEQMINSSLVAGFKLVYQKHQCFIEKYQPLRQISSPVLYLSADQQPHSAYHSVSQWLKDWCCEFKLATARGRHDSLLHRDNIRHSLDLIINFINKDLVQIKPNKPLSKRSESQTLEVEKSLWTH